MSPPARSSADQLSCPFARGRCRSRARICWLKRKEHGRTCALCRAPAKQVGASMKIFLDTAEIDEIRTAARWGVLDGVTTNPSLFAKVGGNYDEVLTQISQIT